ncbi:MAG: pyruvate phosphate dikinase PEP/pyruvate-binding protein [Deferribacteraceae bacterium]|jgi:hypothetical protein|nr:pyruvate phosphate dikinase PEP/pyruvate-binding protein [Deferribacteraceae bacterium]
MEKDTFISTGIPSLDKILDYLRFGDNIVWETLFLKDYQLFVNYFTEYILSKNKTVQYIRFGDHLPLLQKSNKIIVHNVNPQKGFEYFSREIHNIISSVENEQYFVFDPLSSLLSTWLTDDMVANFFLVTCPYLYKVGAVAYFALLKDYHSYSTMAKIKKTTQIYIKNYWYNTFLYIHPQKVYNRSSTTMFLPHRLDKDNNFYPVVNSNEATSLFYSLCSLSGIEHKKLDNWDKMTIRAKDVLLNRNNNEQSEVFDNISKCIIGRDKKILSIVKKHFNLRDLIEIKSRMIGTGFIGGKAVGMLIATKILSNKKDEFPPEIFEPHHTYFIGSNVFHTYIIHNGWWEIYMEHRKKDGYFSAGKRLEKLLLKGDFPNEIIQQFVRMLEYFGQYPIVVRSSSLLEDGFGNAFAGKYESFFCSTQGSPNKRLDEFLYNLKRVYASLMCKEALDYRLRKGLAEADEQMGILVQRVSGCFHGFYYYPHASGVGLSYNTYVWNDNIDPKSGILRIVAGLGTRAVNRVQDDYPRIVALNRPEMTPLNKKDDIRRFSQRYLDVLDIRTSGKKEVSLYDIYNKDFPFDINIIASHDRETEDMLAERGKKTDVWILTFEKLLKKTNFPEVMKKLLKTLEEEYNYPVDIEFTVNFSKENYKINIVQCRPHQTNIVSNQNEDVLKYLDKYKPFFSVKGNFMGGNTIINIQQIVMVKAENYIKLSNSKKYAVAKALRRININAEKNNINTMLITPGRLGTTTPSLGVPVSFADISKMKVIAEVAFEEADLMPELSFGSHFFQDLIESNIFFMAIFPKSPGCTFKEDIFLAFENIYGQLVSDMPELNNVISVYRFEKSAIILKSDIKTQDVILYKQGV